MKEIYSIASSYYDTFYKIHKNLQLSTSLVIFIVSLLSTVTMLFMGLTSLFGIASFSRISTVFLFSLAFFFELLTFLSALYVQKRIIENIKINCSSLSKEQGLSLNDYKKLWLINSFKKPEGELINLAMKIHTIVKTRDEQKINDNLSTKAISMYIFNPEAKNRTLSLFLGLISLITVLFIKGESGKYNIDLMFELLKPSLIWVDFVVCTAIMLVSFMINGIVKNTLPHIFNKKDLEIKTLIRDMIELTRLSINEL